MTKVVCKFAEFSTQQKERIPNRPVEGQEYIVRERVHSSNGLRFLLKEIINPLIDNEEPSFSCKMFRIIEEETNNG